MGFQRRTYRLKFDDPALAGLEVVMRGSSIEELSHFSGLAGAGEKLMSPGYESERCELYAFLASKTVSWNIEDDNGQPILPTADAYSTEEATIVLSIMHAWMDEVAGVPAPLARRSPAGDSLAEASIPMEALSVNPPS